MGKENKSLLQNTEGVGKNEKSKYIFGRWI